jgi:signal transduction histidine kinase
MASDTGWRPGMIFSLQTRLLLAVGLLAVAAVAVVAFTARLSTRQEFQRFRDLERVRDASALDGTLDQLEATLQNACCSDAQMAAAARLAGPDQSVLVFDAKGALIASAGDNVATSDLKATFIDGEMKLDARAGDDVTKSRVSLTLKGGPERRIALADGSPASVHILPPLGRDPGQPADQFLGSVDRRLLYATVVVAVLALGLTWAITRRITGPISELSNATRDLAGGQLSRRVAARGSDEIAELARAFNSMADRLERQESLRRGLLHDVAHELRTPLTALQCRVETLIDGLATDPGPSLGQVNEEVAHLSQLVRDLEELARAEARELALTIVDVDAAEVCRSAVRVAGLESDPRFTLDAEPRLLARADAVRLRQIVLNLLTNADRHTPAGERITVRTFAKDREAVIEVHNTGSSLTAEECERVFDRFFRVDPSRQRATGGSGLGLAIAKHLAEAQGGRVWVRSDAHGVTFGVALPRPAFV